MTFNFLLVACLTALGLLGCGPARPFPVPVDLPSPGPAPFPVPSVTQSPLPPLPVLLPGPVKSVAFRLGLRIVPEHTDALGSRDLRTPWSEANWMDHTLYQSSASFDGEKILYDRVLELTEGKPPLYFVWADHALGAEIVQGFVSHAILDGNNHWIAALSPISVWHDSILHRSFVPIVELFKNSDPRYVIHPEDTQAMHLELIQADGSKSVVEVWFRLKFNRKKEI
jgi:hypothetical protein